MSGCFAATREEEVRKRPRFLCPRRLQAETEKQRARLANSSRCLPAAMPTAAGWCSSAPGPPVAACHTAEKRGGRIGPDLSSVGAVRSGGDLLEALLFPSSSFARGFEPYVVETRQGIVHQGILGRETADALFLVAADRTEVRMSRADIDTLAPERVSIMPQGLETQLSPQELRDAGVFARSALRVTHSLCFPLPLLP